MFRGIKAQAERSAAETIVRLLGDAVSIDQGKEAARICAINLLAQLQAAAGSLDKVLYGYSFEEALDMCLNMKNEEYARSLNRCPSETFLLIRKNNRTTS